VIGSPSSIQLQNQIGQINRPHQYPGQPQTVPSQANYPGRKTLPGSPAQGQTNVYVPPTQQQYVQPGQPSSYVQQGQAMQQRQVVQQGQTFQQGQTRQLVQPSQSAQYVPQRQPQRSYSPQYTQQTQQYRPQQQTYAPQSRPAQPSGMRSNLRQSFIESYNRQNQRMGSRIPNLPSTWRPGDGLGVFGN
jgi:hypothetical protein